MDERFLFRGKRKDNGELVEGYLYITHDGKYEIAKYCDETNIERIAYEVIPKTLACKALEKQIPKKVILGYDEQDSICCPNCNSDIAPMDDLDDCLLYHCPRCGEKDAILQGDNYCFNCGQALDWSDEK